MTACVYSTRIVLHTWIFVLHYIFIAINARMTDVRIVSSTSHSYFSCSWAWTIDVFILRSCLISLIKARVGYICLIVIIVIVIIVIVGTICLIMVRRVTTISTSTIKILRLWSTLESLMKSWICIRFCWTLLLTTSIYYVSSRTSSIEELIKKGLLGWNKVCVRVISRSDIRTSLSCTTSLSAIIISRNWSRCVILMKLSFGRTSFLWLLECRLKEIVV